MLFPKDFPEKLRSTILVSEIVGKKVKLKLRGKEFQGLCPFHNEKSPSFTVNDQKGFYHCFGCAAHGDMISFVMNTEGLDYPAAVAKLADDFGIPIPKINVDPIKEIRLERDYLILEKICQFFERNLFEASGKNAFIYLQKRGINQATIKKFRLGFALNSFEALTNFLRVEKFTDQEISRTGVIGQNEQKKFYDKFRNRIIFPITDKKNRVIAFGGRTIGEDLPKYLNSAETEIFKKNQTLYNFYYARKPIFSKGFAVVVEGYMDAISLMMNGVENVVAGLGTALGEAHLKELFYITGKIVICLDGDSAGVRAAKRVSEIVLPLISAKKNISFTLLPNQMDPDDFIKEFGATALEKAFKASAPLSESLLEFALLELGIDKNAKISAENKAKIEANLTSKIEAIHDISSKKYFSLFFKDSLFLLGRNQKQNPKIFSNFSKKSYANFNSNAADNLARNIIAFIIKHPQLAQFRDDQFDIKELYFSNENLSHLKELTIELIENNPQLSEKTLLESLEKSAIDKDIEKTIKEITIILTHLGDEDLNLILSKFRILLLKDLLLQVDQQYKATLGQIDEIETHQSAITNQKIKEIFSYKNSLEQEIITLEKEII